MVTCPTCLARGMVAVPQDDSFRYDWCPTCDGKRRVANNDPRVLDAIMGLNGQLKALRRVATQREAYILELDDKLRKERASAYAVAQRHGYTGTFSEFRNEVFTGVLSKSCAACGQTVKRDG
jgi:hypothetical protein